MRGPGLTRRSSERAPAGTPSGDAAVPGGWPPSLTFVVRHEYHLEVSVEDALPPRALLVLLKGARTTVKDSDRGARLVQNAPRKEHESFLGAFRGPNVAGVYRVFIL